VRQLERARKRRQREAAKAGTRPPMSQAGLSEQACAAIEEIIDKLGQAQRMSRAGLRRQLRRLALSEMALERPKTGT
jgi:alcohol dehydrogenase class IV